MPRRTPASQPDPKKLAYLARQGMLADRAAEMRSVREAMRLDDEIPKMRGVSLHY